MDAVFVNICDLVDARTSGREVPLFDSELRLAEYSKKIGENLPQGECARWRFASPPLAMDRRSEDGSRGRVELYTGTGRETGEETEDHWTRRVRRVLVAVIVDHDVRYVALYDDFAVQAGPHTVSGSRNQISLSSCCITMTRSPLALKPSRPSHT